MHALPSGACNVLQRKWSVQVNSQSNSTPNTQRDSSLGSGLPALPALPETRFAVRGITPGGPNQELSALAVTEAA